MKPLRKIVPDKGMMEKMQDSAMKIAGTPFHMVHIFRYNTLSWRIEGWTAYFENMSLAENYVEMYEKTKTKNMVAYIDGKVYKENMRGDLEKKLIDTSADKVRRRQARVKAVKEEWGALYDGHHHMNVYLEDEEGSRYLYDLNLTEKRECLTASDFCIHNQK